MYQRRSRLSRRTQERLIEHFIAGTTARAAAQLVGVHRNTAAAYYTRLRHVIAEEMENMVPMDGEVEVDESYFGGSGRDDAVAAQRARLRCLAC